MACPASTPGAEPIQSGLFGMPHCGMLRRLSGSLVEAREQERRRIARELHDELGQRLTALKMGVASLSGIDAVQARVDDMLSMLDETIASVRRISADLRPMMLDDLGLNAALEWLARDANRRLGFAIRLHLDEIEPPVDDRLATGLYRMVQEALTNVARHAHASQVTIDLRQQHDLLVLTIGDDGIGYPDDALHRNGSYGLLGICERADMFAGTMSIGNPATGGGRLTVKIPLVIDPQPSPPRQSG